MVGEGVRLCSRGHRGGGEVAGLLEKLRGHSGFIKRSSAGDSFLV